MAGQSPNFVERFAGRRLIGVNVSMLEPIDTWNPFDLLLERDSSACVRPDITMLTSAARVPVVGIVLVHDQKEYRNGLHDAANSAIARLMASRAMAAVRIDTRLDTNATGLRTAAEVESLIARMDVVVTTRLHGLVLAIKNGVPAVAIDPIAGGAKLLRQANVLEWPICFTADGLDDDRLVRAFEYGADGGGPGESQGVRRAGAHPVDRRARTISRGDRLAVSGRLVARIVVGSYMVRYPLGGMMSCVLQYLVGFQRLGHDVFFVEKAGTRTPATTPSGTS